MSSLNIEIFELSDTHVSVYTFSFIYHFELSYSSTCPLYRGNLIMSPTWQIILVVLSAKLKATLGHLCVVRDCSRIYPCIWLLSWFHDYPIWVSFVSTFPYPVPSHSCDPLEDVLTPSSQYGFSSALPEDEDLEFWRWYLRIHYHYWWTPLLQLSVSPIDWQSVEFFPCSTSTHLFTS